MKNYKLLNQNQKNPFLKNQKNLQIFSTIEKQKNNSQNKKIIQKLTKSNNYAYKWRLMGSIDGMPRGDKKIRNQLLQLKQKQDNELNALRQRIISGQDEQRKVRSLELERLLQKYQNVKKELDTQQQNEIIRLEKALANPGMSDSRYSAMNSSRYQSNNTSRMSQQQSKRKQEVNEVNEGLSLIHI
eukprot:TRINITY_DN6129_c0_g2_i1.p2 TRINITY_DN6129_c0_g2~~TRINITY_DN6129_c0_g2_i1.p2  ORF type:complete len:186 (+),score=14.43 TRINITY_DN6129_c0_g2_i1:3-560(+)